MFESCNFFCFFVVNLRSCSWFFPVWIVPIQIMQSPSTGYLSCSSQCTDFLIPKQRPTMISSLWSSDPDFLLYRCWRFLVSAALFCRIVHSSKLVSTAHLSVGFCSSRVLFVDFYCYLCLEILLFSSPAHLFSIPLLI